MSTTLEQRIATALADDATSSTRSALIEDADAEQARVNCGFTLGRAPQEASCSTWIRA
jgi:hypothetical protein